MTLIQIQYALEVYKERSITKAAENLYTTTSNVSKSLRSLEKEMGFSIFVKQLGGLYPTAYGEEFLKLAQKIILDINNMMTLGKNKLKILCMNNMPFFLMRFLRYMKFTGKRKILNLRCRWII